MTPSDVASYNHQLTHCSIVVAWWLLAPHCLRRRCLVTAGASFPPSPGDCRRLTVSVRRRRLVTAGASLSLSSSRGDLTVSIVLAWWLLVPHCLRLRHLVTAGASDAALMFDTLLVYYYSKRRSWKNHGKVLQLCWTERLWTMSYVLCRFSIVA